MLGGAGTDGGEGAAGGQQPSRTQSFPRYSAVSSSTLERNRRMDLRQL